MILGGKLTGRCLRGSCGGPARGARRRAARLRDLSEPGALDALAPQPATTGIFPIFARHSAGPDLWTAFPAGSTATITGMSLTSNS